MKIIPGTHTIASMVACGMAIDYITVTTGWNVSPYALRYGLHIGWPPENKPGEYMWPVMGQRVCIECLDLPLDRSEGYQLEALIEAVLRDGAASVIVLADPCKFIDGRHSHEISRPKALTALARRRLAYFDEFGFGESDRVLMIEQGHDGLSELIEAAEAV